MILLSITNNLMKNRSLFANIFTTVHSSLARQAAGWLFPWKRTSWKVWSQQEACIEVFREVTWLTEEFVICPMYNARSALYHGLQILDIWPWDEVIIQAYTCVSVPNAIIWTWAFPIYVDIDLGTANIDPELLEQAITPKTKAIVVQHTFGIVADMKRIGEICTKHNILLIEDCAHALGASYDGKSVWSFGDMALFSLGRDKVLTTTNWWFLVMKSSYTQAVGEVKKDLISLPFAEIWKNVLYLLLCRWAYLLYDLKIGKILYYLAAKMKMIPLIITSAEKKCQFTDFSYAYPNLLAWLACNELKRLQEVTNQRREWAKSYLAGFGDNVLVPAFSGDCYLRIVYKTAPGRQKEYIRKAKKHGLHLGDPWYESVIAGRWVNFTDAKYTLWSCPQAELLASQTINLPNHSLMKKADYERVIEVVKEIDMNS